MIFDVPNGETLPADLKRSFENIRRGRRPIGDRREKQELRASSFPICPRAYHIFRRTPPGKRPKYEESFVSEAATSMGTAIHLVLQKWFSIQGSLYGNWVCVHCKKIRRHALGVQKCQICKREMIYHEYEVAPSPQTPFSGHIDGIIKTVGGWYLIDFKGASAPLIRDLKQKNKPKESHYLQVNAYANAVNLNPKAYGSVGKISKIIIIYVDRGQAHRLWLPMKVKVSERIYRETIGRIQVAKNSLKNMEIPRGLCVQPSDDYARYCPWKQTCFSPAIEGLLSSKVEPIGERRQHRSEQELMMLASYLQDN